MAQITFTDLSWNPGTPATTRRPSDPKPPNSVMIRDMAVPASGEPASKAHDDFSTFKRVDTSAHMATSQNIGDDQFAMMMANLQYKRADITVYWNRDTNGIRFCKAGTDPENTDEFEVPHIPNPTATLTELGALMDDFYADCLIDNRPQTLPRAHTASPIGLTAQFAQRPNGSSPATTTSGGVPLRDIGGMGLDY